MRKSRLPNLPLLIRDSFRFSLTSGGKLLIVGFFLAFMTGPITLAVPIYHIFVSIFVLLGMVVIVALLCQPKIEVTGDMIAKAVAGESFGITFGLRNRSRFPAYDVSISYFDLPPSLREIEPGRLIRRMGPGDSEEYVIHMDPLRRGLFEIPGPRYYSTYPFNLFRIGPRNKHTNSLLVLPHFHPIEDIDIPVSARYQPGGISMTSHVGESPEYIGNRDYRPGDPLRRIDTKAWARLAKPIVKEYNEEYYCRIAIVLDTYIPGRRISRPEGFEELEAAISLTASIADAVSRGEYIIDIFAAGPDLYVFRSGRHTAHFENVLEILAALNESRKNPFDIVTPALADELNNISSVVFILLDWDDSRESLVHAAVEAGCNAKTFIVRNKPTTLSHQDAENWAGPITVLSPSQVRSGEMDRL